ncbi:MAG TPA: acyl-CoA dehydrogenase family protein [Gemmatimonadaceae bacterium]|nr:acyl-CoA dehydrogenase family protein [Gemmatimonadaceae bacterium]
MNFSHSTEHQRLQDEITAFARTELNGGAAERDRAQLFPRDLWLRCGELRLQGLMIPEVYGGRGLDPVSSTVALEALGHGCEDGGLSFSLCAHLLACVVPVWKHGTEEQKRRYLPGMSDGSIIAANAMSEPASGSDAFALTTRAEPEEGGFLLNGTKTFCSNGPYADVIVTYAATDLARAYHGGITAFIVPRETDGLRTGPPFDKLGLRTSHMSEVVFENAWVSSDAVLGGVGGGSSVFSQSMDWERACLGGVHIGTMQRLLELVVTHARTRMVSGEPIGKHQGVSHPVADMKVRLEAARLLVYRAAARLDRARDISMDAAIAKLFVSEALVATAQDAVRAFGADGVIEGHPAERALRDAVSSTLYSGTSEIQRNIIARWLGL